MPQSSFLNVQFEFNGKLLVIYSWWQENNVSRSKGPVDKMVGERDYCMPCCSIFLFVMIFWSSSTFIFFFFLLQQYNIHKWRAFFLRERRNKSNQEKVGRFTQSLFIISVNYLSISIYNECSIIYYFISRKSSLFQ